MVSGLLALLDDVAALTRAVAASADDVALLTGKAGTKAAGVVVDDAAVTPGYVVGIPPDRELPIVAKIAVGSLKNKLLVLLPGALVLSYFAPWAILPLLVIGGAYLSFEGAEKLLHAVLPHHEESSADEGSSSLVPPTPAALEAMRVRGAIATDLVLSAEIMAITLSAVAEETTSIAIQAVVLIAVGIGITVLVYGAVALIVRADEAGLAMMRWKSAAARAFGRALVHAMPPFLNVLGRVGTFAMLWVGGGIVIHGTSLVGAGWIEHAVHHLSEEVGHVSSVLGWLVGATISAIVGVFVGGLCVLAATWIVRPVAARFRARRRAA